MLAIYKLAISFAENPTIFVQQVVNGLQLGFVYALIALGYTMVYGIVRLINFAHGDVFMVGAFTSYYAIARWGLQHLAIKGDSLGIPVWLSMVIGVITVILLSMVTCAFLAFIIERIAYKPLRTAPRISALDHRDWCFILSGIFWRFTVCLYFELRYLRATISGDQTGSRIRITSQRKRSDFDHIFNIMYHHHYPRY